MQSTSRNSDSDNTQLRILQMCAVDFTVKQFLLPLSRALMDKGYAVDIACARGPYFEQIQAAGFNMIENPVSRSVNVLHHARSLLNTYRLLRRGKYDILHVHTPVAALLGRLAARLAGVPLKIYTAHGFYFHEQMKPALRQALILLEKIGSACGDFIMTVSKEDEAAALGLRIATPGSIETIYNGVDVERFSKLRFAQESDLHSPPLSKGTQTVTSSEISAAAQSRAAVRQRFNFPPDSYVIGIVGRLVREKGFFELFDAAKIIQQTHPQVRILVVGDVLPSDYDASKNEVHERLRHLNLTQIVVFAGMVDDTAPYLNAIDCFALPSYREGMPISLLEAMAMELPCVATDIRGCREEIVNGESGWLVPTKDAPALADRLLWFLDHPTEAVQMGIRARQRVLQNFNLEKVIAHQLQIYSRLTERLRTPR